MFNFFKPKIIFECAIPSVSKIMPIIPSKEYRHGWVNKAIDEYKKLKESPDFFSTKSIHTAKCPGIFNLMRHGWIMRTWQDIFIETNGDGESFIWKTPIDQKQLSNNSWDYVSVHHSNQYYSYMENFSKNTLKSIIKIQSPWFCVVPKGYYLLEMPVVYSDENRFTTAHGVFTHEEGLATLNPQLFWHELNGKTLIKAGTPIAQYILVKKEKVDMSIKNYEIDSLELDSLIKNMRFVSNHNFTKNFYKTH